MGLPRFARNDKASKVLAITAPSCRCEERSDEAVSLPYVVARHDSAEAISAGRWNCRASLTMPMIIKGYNDEMVEEK
jgi:hypothetical protein